MTSFDLIDLDVPEAELAHCEVFRSKLIGFFPL